MAWCQLFLFFRTRRTLKLFFSTLTNNRQAWKNTEVVLQYTDEQQAGAEVVQSYLNCCLYVTVLERHTLNIYGQKAFGVLLLKTTLGVLLMFLI